MLQETLIITTVHSELKVEIWKEGGQYGFYVLLSSIWCIYYTEVQNLFIIIVSWSSCIYGCSRGLYTCIHLVLYEWTFQMKGLIKLCSLFTSQQILILPYGAFSLYRKMNQWVEFLVFTMQWQENLLIWIYFAGICCCLITLPRVYIRSSCFGTGNDSKILALQYPSPKCG